MIDPWGLDEPPAAFVRQPLPPRLARLAEVERTGVPMTDIDPYEWSFPAASELPEVADLIAAGWHPLEDAPLYCLLPAAWPAELRTWVPDRLPRVSMGSTTETLGGTVEPPFPPDPDWPEEVDGADEAERLGLPVPPTGRIWLVRSPWPRIPVVAIHHIVWATVQRDPHWDEIVRVYEVTRDVLTWSEQRALDACPADTRRLIEEWADAGRVGEAAAEFIGLDLSPADLSRLTSTGLDEATALEWLASLQAQPEDAVDFIVAWRASGLPGNPPAGADRFSGLDPAELRAWVDAGFDLPAAAGLRLAGLATAVRWRAAGFTEAETYELLRADPALTPEEARRFDALGLASDERRHWIYRGFSAEEAGAWTAKGLDPGSAGLWRSVGGTADDAEHGQQFPPALIEGHGPYFGLHEFDDIDDPPGTRGRRARRRAGDDDPWINTD